MSEDARSRHEQLAAAFDRETDPLAKYETTFDRTAIDPFALFVDEVLAAKDITPRTRDDYDRVIRQWRTHMDTIGRHPACPAPRHIRGFIEHERDERENHPDTIKEKLRKLREIYSYWQAVPSCPHPSEFDPFDIVRQRVSLDAPEQKPLPQIPLTELREFIANIDRLRNLAIVLMQLKLGLRASEVCNLVIGELDIQRDELARHYSTLGDHWMLDGRPNAVYIPHDRYGNKSGRPRVLPLDEELQTALIRYLLVRLDVDSPWVFLSQRGNQLQKDDVATLWRDLFHPTYAETEHHRGISSHYGRHRFTTYWRVKQDLARPLVKYLRGDRPGSVSITERDGIDQYIHTYYEDIERVVRTNSEQFDLK